MTLGLAGAYNLSADWLVGAKLEVYEQRTGWRLGGEGSIGLDPLRATWFQLGLEKRF